MKVFIVFFRCVVFDLLCGVVGLCCEVFFLKVDGVGVVGEMC